MNKNNHFLIKVFFWPIYAFAYGLNAKETYKQKQLEKTAKKILEKNDK